LRRIGQTIRPPFVGSNESEQQRVRSRANLNECGMQVALIAAKKLSPCTHDAVDIGRGQREQEGHKRCSARSFVGRRR
jgi:hypothetical protein